MEPGEITLLLQDAAQGNREAFDRLLPLVYEELRTLAHGRLRFERGGHTLNTTALVHEAYIRLVGQTRTTWHGRRHFLAAASEAMRRILVDYARQRRTQKRGAALPHVPLEDADRSAPIELFTDGQATELIALDEALTRLADFSPDGARVVQYRFFGGLSTEEVAEVMGTSERTVRRVWSTTRAWLLKELDDATPASGSLLNPHLGSA